MRRVYNFNRLKPKEKNSFMVDSEYQETFDDGISWFVINKKQQHWEGPYQGNSENWLSFSIENYCIDEIRSSFSWKDQGWGNRKGMLVLVLKAEDGSEICRKDFSTDLAEHDWITIDVCFNPDEEIVNKYYYGCQYEVIRYVGGGGGHELFVNDFKIAFIGSSAGLK